MNILVPGFKQFLTAPVSETLKEMRKFNSLPNIHIYADRADFQKGGPWPVEGAAKYWNFTGNVPSAIILSGLWPDGTFAKAPARTMEFGIHMSIYKDWDFVIQRSISQPYLYMVSLSAYEMGRISFPSEIIEDPIDYPICEVYDEKLNSEGSHSFSKSCFLYVKDEIFYLADTGDPIVDKLWRSTFSFSSGPTGVNSAISADVAWNAILKTATQVSPRISATNINKTPGSSADHLAKFLSSI
jgi:hypothetical protein